MIRIYNSLTNQIEEFKPIHPNRVQMYVCGSTVYNNMHIGNTRPVIFFDVVARFFTYMGYEVQLVSNFTDIDDKIIHRAKNENTTETEISERYIREILNTYHKLNCLPHYKNPKVTETIPEIIDFIQVLLDKNGAYQVGGDVYFSIDQVPDYGILSGQTKDKLVVGARIEENEKKRNPIDFNLWKETEEGRRWHSPWSEGRPGWHTECVVMIDTIFHDKIDIHGGGSDIKFPHHDNEIAQAEIACGHKIANYWMHNGRIDMQGEKMSKSIGNMIMADDLVNQIGYQMYRLLLLNVPYRQPLSYKEELLTQVKLDFEKIYRGYMGLFRRLQIEYDITTPADAILANDLKVLEAEFITAMSDDFNTANGLTVIFKLIKLINQLSRQKEIDTDYANQTITLTQKLLWIFGMEFKEKPLTTDELSLVLRWKQAREAKQFDLADTYRLEMQNKGIVI